MHLHLLLHLHLHLHLGLHLHQHLHLNLHLNLHLLPRYSDNCAGQYKSQFCLHRLRTAPTTLGLPCQVVHWCYFEPDHGKSLSDMLGSLCKISLEKAAARDAEFCARTPEEVAAAVSTHLADKSKEFAAIKVLVVPPFLRPKEKPGCVVPAIQKVRHVTRTATGDLLAREKACIPCLELGNVVCPTCTSLPPSYPKQGRGRAIITDTTAQPAAEEGEHGEEEDGEDRHQEEEEGEEEGATIPEEDVAEQMGDERAEEQEAQEAEEEQREPGQVHWAREERGQYWPCLAVPLAMVPAAIRQRQGLVPSSNTWVQMLGEGREEDYKSFPCMYLSPLLPGSTSDVERIGEDRAKQAAYNMAVYAMNGY